MELRSLTFPRGPVFDADGELAVGHALACYYPGTDTLRTWYADAGLTTPAPNPDLVGSDGRIAQKFLGSGPSEIRQYSPVSPSSVIPDDLQDFPGSEWALEWSWLEDGVSPSPGAVVLIVDTVDELRALEDEDAKKGLVAVRGYYAAADKIGVRFYQYKSASSPSDDGGAVLGSAMGGRWFLKVQTADVDVRWWGALPDTAEDRSSAIAAAAAWTSANGVTLWFTAGCYQVVGGSVSLGPVRIDEGVTFNATDSVYALTLTSAWEIGGTSALKDAASSYAVRVNFGAGATVGTVYTAWNGTDADLTRYPGQHVVVAAGSDGLSNLSGAVTLASLTLSADVTCGLANLLTVGTLVSNGFTLTNDSGSSLTIGRFDRAPGDPAALDWTTAGGTLTVLSDFRASDVDGLTLDYLQDAAIVLTVDADRTLSASRVWSSVTLQTAGGLLAASADTVEMGLKDVRGDGVVFGAGWSNGTAARILIATWGSLRAVHFGGTLGDGSFASITMNHASAEVDLEGWTANVSQLWLSSNPRIRNGRVNLSYNAARPDITSALELADLTLNFVGGTLVVADGGALQLTNCTVSADTMNSSFIQIGKSADTVGGEIGIFENCVFSKFMRVQMVAGSTATTPPFLRATDCVFQAGFHDGIGPLSLTGDIELEHCTVSAVVFLVDAPRYVRIHNCLFVMQPGDSSNVTALIDVSDVTYANNLMADISGNTPELLVSSDTTSKYWPQTRGHFRVLNADPNDPCGPFRTGMFCGVGSGGTVIKASGCFVASCPMGYVATHHSTDPTGGVELDPNSSASPTVDIDVIFDISR